MGAAGAIAVSKPRKTLARPQKLSTMRSRRRELNFRTAAVKVSLGSSKSRNWLPCFPAGGPGAFTPNRETKCTGSFKGLTGRGSWIRTNDLQYRKLPRHQAALYPVGPGIYRVSTLPFLSARSGSRKVETRIEIKGHSAGLSRRRSRVRAPSLAPFNGGISIT